MIFYIAVRVLDIYGTFAIMYLARQLGKMGALHPTRANN